MRFLRPLSATCFAASLIALSACSSSSSNGMPYSIPDDADLVVKAVPTIRWDASEYIAEAGEIKVFLANDDNVKHILVIRQGDTVVGELKLSVAQKNDVAAGTINLEPGSYSVYCIIPGHSIMKSKLTVS